MTVITDSVGGVLSSATKPREDLGARLDLRLEAEPCRKLVDPGCPSGAPDGPESALATIERLGPQLGRVVVIDVGYNDYYNLYGAGLDEVMHALVAAGVQHVVWVTLEATEPGWIYLNNVIRAAPARWPQIVVADWAPVSAGQPWFVDHAHMNYQGAVAFSAFLRPFVLQACGAPCAPPPPVFCGLARTVNGFDAIAASIVDVPRRPGDDRSHRTGRPRALELLTCSPRRRRARLPPRRGPARGARTIAGRHGPSRRFRQACQLVVPAAWDELDGRIDVAGPWHILVARAPYCQPKAPRPVSSRCGCGR